MFGPEVVVYCERTEHMHCLDAPASVIWALCDGSRLPAEITVAAAAVAGADPASIEDEVEAMIESFRQLGLLR